MTAHCAPARSRVPAQQRPAQQRPVQPRPVRDPFAPGHLSGLVRRSTLPVVLVRLADGCLVEASDAFLSYIGRDHRSVVGTPVAGYTEQPEVARRSLSLVASGTLDGYTRRAAFRRPTGELVRCELRITACAEEDRRHAVVSVLPPHWAVEGSTEWEDPTEEPRLVMGTVDGRWTVDRITASADDAGTFSARELVNRSFFVAVHPEDVGEVMFVAAQASNQQGAAFGRVRTKAPTGGWVMKRLGLQPLGDLPSSGYAFVLLPGCAALGQSEPDDIEAVAETTLANVRASTIASWMVAFPTALELPELNELTPREYEILLRLSAGERVRMIASALHLSESTVRNHLTSIFRKTGVRSQGELLSRLREHR